MANDLSYGSHVKYAILRHADKRRALFLLSLFGDKLVPQQATSKGGILIGAAFTCHRVISLVYYHRKLCSLFDRPYQVFHEMQVLCAHRTEHDIGSAFCKRHLLPYPGRKTRQPIYRTSSPTDRKYRGSDAGHHSHGT